MTTRDIESVVGREREVAALTAFLDSIPRGPRALLLEGEPGIGKTTLWRDALRHAGDRGYRVLQARPAESEARLSFAALADIVGAAFDEAGARLPGPQEHALAVALLRKSADGPADARTTGTALVGVLSAIASEVPVLVAIDDAQWLDPASERALAFAARRLPPRLGLLVARRTGGDAEAPLGLDSALPDRLERVVPGPLSLAALHHVIGSRLGKTFARPTLTRIAEVSGGNPFFALEIARPLARDEDDPDAGRPLPIPPGVQRLAAERVEALSGAAQQAVLIAASLSRPTLAAVADALPAGGDALTSLAEAEAAGVLVTERGRLRFTHPLLASAVYGSISEPRRRQLHSRLAEVVAEPEERARHLAQSMTAADEVAAAEVEQAGRRALLRGAYDAAAELLEASRRLTPADRPQELVRRTLVQASAVLKAGDVADARSLAESATADGLPPLLEAERFELLAEIAWDDGATKLATEHLERALVAAGDDRAVSARVLTRLVLVGMPADPARALEHAERAMGLLSEEREPGLVGSILIDRFVAGVLLGRGARVELLQRGLELEAQAGPAAYPHPAPLIWYQCVDDVEATTQRYLREDEWARDRGDELLAGERLGYLALLELQAGRWERAEQHAARSCEAIEQRLDVGGRFAYVFAWRALIDAHRGRFERARATLRPLVEEAARTEKAWWGAILLSVVGFVEFAAGEHAAADDALVRMSRLLDGIGIRDGLLDRTEPFHVESLVALGEIARAREVLALREQRGRTIPRLWIDVTLPRARALVLAAEDDTAAALAALDELDVVAASRLPFELASAWLVKGRLCRRLKQRRAAAEAFGDALAIFERLGAPTWERQARDELARVGPRRRSPDELTATELRVAELAAEGMTNREVAQAAFMSAKTVEAHLARVYRKLGIRSRAELGAHMVRQPRSAESEM